MDTMSNLVAYRGHQNPVWDVEWSPMGIYFASASRDKTARLWSTDKINALRVYAGHLSDVDVSIPGINHICLLFPDAKKYSVSSFIQILFTWLLDLVIGHVVYGMCKEELQCEYSLAIRDLYLLLP